VLPFFVNTASGRLSETENDTAKYIVAVEVSTLENIPTGLIGRRFDAAEYAVFDCTLEDETSGKFFQYFFKTFLKENIRCTYQRNKKSLENQGIT
jgi:predicted transcriptional regulator YdeE